MHNSKFKKFTDEELERLRIYVEKADELKNSQVHTQLSQSLEAEINISISESTGRYTYTSSNKELLISFLVTFRQLYNDYEDFSFVNTHNLVYKKTLDEKWLDYLSKNRKSFKQEKNPSLGTIIGKKNYDGDRLLEYLFYLGAIHTDKKYYETWKDIKGTPMEPWIHFVSYNMVLNLCNRIIWLSEFIKREILK